MPYSLTPVASGSSPTRTNATPQNGGVTNGRLEATVVASGVASYSLGIIPANSYVYAYEILCQVAGTITTGAELNLGHSGSVEAILAGNTFTGIDAVGDRIGPVELATPVLYRAATELLASSSSTGGSAVGSLDTGTWSIVIHYREYSTTAAL